MGWARFDDAFTDHPKIRAVGVMAELLAMRAVVYAARYETDGFIRRSSLDQLTHGIPTPKRQVSSLIREKLWEEVDDGWIIHDYLHFHPSKAELEAKRQAARERMANVRANKQRTEPEQTDPVRENFALPRPDPTPIEEAKASSTAFVAFNTARAVDAVRKRQKDGLPVKSPGGLARTIAADPDHVTESQRLWAHRNCTNCKGAGYTETYAPGAGQVRLPCQEVT